MQINLWIPVLHLGVLLKGVHTELGALRNKEQEIWNSIVRLGSDAVLQTLRERVQLLLSTCVLTVMQTLQQRVQLLQSICVLSVLQTQRQRVQLLLSICVLTVLQTQRQRVQLLLSICVLTVLQTQRQRVQLMLAITMPTVKGSDQHSFLLPIVRGGGHCVRLSTLCLLWMVNMGGLRLGT